MDSLSQRAYRLLLKMAPPHLRRSHGPEIERAFAQVLREEVSRRGPSAHLLLWPLAAWDLMRSRLTTPSFFLRGSQMNWINLVRQDVRQGLRSLIRSPGFTLTALLTLSLGIGANTAIFSVVNAVILRPLPFPEPDRLAVLWESAPSLGFTEVGFSPPDWRMFQERQGIYSQAGTVDFVEAELTGGSTPPQRAVVGRTTSGFFRALNRDPQLGRYTTTEEDRPGILSAVISHDLWMNRYGGQREVIGQTLLLERKSYQIVGVLPRDFRLTFPGHPFAHRPADAWISRGFTDQELANFGSGYSNAIVARLKTGLSWEEAQTKTNALLDNIFEDYPPQLKGFLGEGLEAVVRPLQLQITGAVRTPLLILLIAVGLVLLIGCTNIANLLLSRASKRGREFAMRRALGAGRGRLAVQLLLECLPLSLVGGLLGVGLAYLLHPLLLRTAPLPFFRSTPISIDGHVLAFAAGLSILTVLLFGLAPGLSASRQGVATMGRELRSTAGTGTRGLQRLFAIGQMALALLLLVGAGLLVRSFHNLLQVQPGFQPQGLVSVNVALPLEGYSEAHRIRAFYQDLLRQAASLPGVTAVGASTDLPLSPTEHRAFLKEGEVSLEGAPPRAVAHSWILGDYLQTMGVPLIRGRWFSLQDHREAAPVMLISRGMAEQYWPDEDPIGQRIQSGGMGWQTIIGIVGDVSDRSLDQTPRGHSYSLHTQEKDPLLTAPSWNGLRSLNLVLRSQGGPTALVEDLRATLRRLDPQLAFSDIRTLQQLLDDSMTAQRFSAGLLATFALLALFLSGVGIASVMSHSVHSRRREMGIRLALGAKPGELQRIILKHGLTMALIGAVLGLLGAWALSRVLADLLFGITATDPATFVVFPLVLLAVALASIWIPARRASKTDPVVTLRCE